jgi:DNA-binding NarL/FixJ family response regulator
LRLAEDIRPHLVLMDIRMPEIDGLEATLGIKSRWPEIKVLVLSLYEGRQEEARAAGADLFVSKGESPERLLWRLGHYAFLTSIFRGKYVVGLAAPRRR